MGAFFSCCLDSGSVPDDNLSKQDNQLVNAHKLKAEDLDRIGQTTKKKPFNYALKHAASQHGYAPSALYSHLLDNPVDPVAAKYMRPEELSFARHCYAPEIVRGRSSAELVNTHVASIGGRQPIRTPSSGHAINHPLHRCYSQD
ncbi:uncharacterized protein LOC129582760 isoform X2 [Paramacrobiotus metropolitanus]|uniref:uncharacterized protein LOC129582760 isoform X2 n=1 Tax=Paramacrobiotus metropolitanus TaxID=2943436 RepID=UPI00244561F4|nr:uncharacterized protein LOC129582760 isoform X2 [Paramacrobiotus metropolitanus]